MEQEFKDFNQSQQNQEHPFLRCQYPNIQQMGQFNFSNLLEQKNQIPFPKNNQLKNVFDDIYLQSEQYAYNMLEHVSQDQIQNINKSEQVKNQQTKQNIQKLKSNSFAQSTFQFHQASLEKSQMQDQNANQQERDQNLEQKQQQKQQDQQQYIPSYEMKNNRRLKKRHRIQKSKQLQIFQKPLKPQVQKKSKKFSQFKGMKKKANIIAKIFKQKQIISLDQIVEQLNNPQQSIKNIRRRVYDVLNVLKEMEMIKLKNNKYSVKVGNFGRIVQKLQIMDIRQTLEKEQEILRKKKQQLQQLKKLKQKSSEYNPPIILVGSNFQLVSATTRKIKFEFDKNEGGQMQEYKLQEVYQMMKQKKISNTKINNNLEDDYDDCDVQ